MTDHQITVVFTVGPILYLIGVGLWVVVPMVRAKMHEHDSN
jgi:hypothetical protein